MKRWARWTSVCFAIGMLLTMSAFLVFAVGYERPALLRYYATMPNVVPAPWLTATPALPGLVYATGVLVVMYLPHVRAAFADPCRRAERTNG